MILETLSKQEITDIYAVQTVRDICKKALLQHGHLLIPFLFYSDLFQPFHPLGLVSAHKKDQENKNKCNDEVEGNDSRTCPGRWLDP